MMLSARVNAAKNTAYIVNNRRKFSLVSNTLTESFGVFLLMVSIITIYFAQE